MNQQHLLFENTLNLSNPEQSYLGDHKIFGLIVLPAAANLELLLSLGKAVFNTDHLSVSHLKLHQLLPLSLSRPSAIKVEVAATCDNSRQVTIRAGGGKEAYIFATAQISEHLLQPSPRSNVAPKVAATGASIDQKVVYEQLRENGRLCESRFQVIQQLSIDSDRSVHSALKLPEGLMHAGYACHPALLDGVFQACAFSLINQHEPECIYLPTGVDQCIFYRSPGRQTSLYAKTADSAPTSQSCRRFDVALFDVASGELHLELLGLTFEAAGSQTKYLLQEQESVDDLFFEVIWKETPKQFPQNPTTPNGARTAESPGGHKWLILPDRSGVGARLAECLAASGDDVVVTAHLDISPATFESSSQLEEQIRTFVEQSPDTSIRGMIYCGALDMHMKSTTSNFIDEQAFHCDRIVKLIQSLNRCETVKPSRLWLITQGAQMIAGQETVNVMQSPLIGLSKTISLEHPEINCSLVDLDPRFSTAEAAEQLNNELQADDFEEQVALRQSCRYVARAVRKQQFQSPPLPAVWHRYQLTSNPGRTGLQLAEKEIGSPPSSGEIEVEIMASGVTPYDISVASNGKDGLFGCEFAGTVSACADSAPQMHLGDSIFGIATNSFTDRLTTSEQFSVLKPKSLSFEEAAALPFSFLTAYICLCEHAQIKAGSTIVVDAQQGPVALAAVQIAHKLGARIIATVGHPSERAYFSSLGVSQIFDWQQDFAEQILALTGGNGVDVVLNSLRGNLISAALNIVKDGGHFFELGVSGAWTEDDVAQAYPFVHYKICSTATLIQESRDRIRPCLQVLCDWVEAGDFVAPSIKSYPLRHAPEAFRSSDSAHFRKPVLTSPKYDASMRLRPDKTYLVTGGFGGLGIDLCQWLAEHGAKNIAVLGRTNKSPKGSLLIEHWRSRGTKISVYPTDLAVREELRRSLDQIRCELPPISGVFHLAGEYRDAIVLNQTRENFAKVFGAKVLGSWNLHELTLQDKLDHFVMYSSAAAMFGSPGQSNYAAADSFLDALAHYRHGQGLPALAINWGAWLEIGHAAELINRGVLNTNTGLRNSQAFKALSWLLRDDSTASVGVVAVNENTFSQTANIGRAFIGEIVATFSKQAKRTNIELKALIDRLESRPSREQILPLLRGYIEHVARDVFKWPEEEGLQLKSGFFELGMDSLMAAELATRLKRDLGDRAVITTPTVYSHSSIEALIQYLAQELQQSSVSPRKASLRETPVNAKSIDRETSQLANKP